MTPTELKFRAWLKESKEMVDVCEIDFTDKSITYASNNPREWLDFLAFFDEIELMPSIGKQDINGKEIYVDDIVKFQNKLYKIAYNKEDSMFRCENLPTVIYLFIEDIEVVGNIYENPELLEDNK